MQDQVQRSFLVNMALSKVNHKYETDGISWTLLTYRFQSQFLFFAVLILHIRVQLLPGSGTESVLDFPYQFAPSKDKFSFRVMQLLCDFPRPYSSMVEPHGHEPTASWGILQSCRSRVP